MQVPAGGSYHVPDSACALSSWHCQVLALEFACLKSLNALLASDRHSTRTLWAQDHALTLQSQLAEAQEAAAARAGEHAAAEAALEAQLDEAAAGHVALRAQTEALAGERDAALAQRDAATARASALAAEKAAVVSELAALRGQIAELEARKQVDLRIAVSYEQVDG